MEVRKLKEICDQTIFINSNLFLVSVITRNVIITDSPRMNESLVAVLLYLFGECDVDVMNDDNTTE
jgi:hypothetical protein